MDFSISRTSNNNETFTFIVCYNKYICLKDGAKYSKVIRELLENDPTIDQYEYKNYKGRYNTFHCIIDLFYFKTIRITIDNVKSFQKIAEDLQIEVLLDKINEFFELYESSVNKNGIVDDLFAWLYHIDTITVKTVKNSIIKSIWSQNEENVKELAAAIFQVVRTKIKLHPYLLDLLIELEKSSNDRESLNLLIPFIVNHLIKSFYKSNLYCAFIYQLSKINRITIKEILNQIFIVDTFSDNRISTNSQEEEEMEKNNHRNLMLWFFPEILKYEPSNINQILIGLTQSETEFINFYINHIDNYKKMRDSGEPEDKVTQAILRDDVDSLQALITNTNIDINKDFIPLNIFDVYNQNIKKTYINFAAQCGSVKTFKYLLINHAKFDKFSLGFAVFGGNSEIVRIVDQQYNNSYDVNIFDLSTFRYYSNCNYLINPIIPAILTHNYDLFAWFLDKENRIDLIEQCIDSIYCCIAIDGNLNALIQLNDREISFLNNQKNLEKIIKLSAESGFYRFTEFLLKFNNLFNVLSENPENFEFCSYCFGSLSIFKLFINSKNEKINFNKLLESVILQSDLCIVKYIIEELYLPTESNQILYIFECAISLKSSSIFDYLETKFSLDDLKDKYGFNLSNYQSLLENSCSSGNLEIVQKITDFIIRKYPNSDFSIFFIKASKLDHENICQYFIEKKVLIDKNKILKDTSCLMKRTKKFIQSFITSFDQQTNEIFSKILLTNAFVDKNVELINILLNKNSLTYDSLMYAVDLGDIEIFNKVLQFVIDDPSCVNQVYRSGTALYFAVNNNNKEIVQRLLEISYINANLYESENGNTPLITAAENKNYEIAKLLVEFPSTNINFRNFEGETALSRAISKKDEKIVLLLINSEKFDPVASRLDYCFYISDEKIAKQLISIKGLDVNFINEFDFYITTLLNEIDLKRIEKIKMIISHPSFDPVKSQANEEIMEKVKQMTDDKPIIDAKFTVNSSLSEPGIIHKLKMMMKTPYDHFFIAGQSSNDIYNLIYPYSQDYYDLSCSDNSYIDFELKEEISINSISIWYSGIIFNNNFNVFINDQLVVTTNIISETDKISYYFESIPCKKLSFKSTNLLGRNSKQIIKLNGVELYSKKAKYSKGVFQTLFDNNEFHNTHIGPVILSSSNFDLSSFYLINPTKFIATSDFPQSNFYIYFHKGLAVITGFRLKQIQPRLKGFKIIYSNNYLFSISDKNSITLFSISDKKINESQDLEVFEFENPSPPVRFISIIQTEPNSAYNNQLKFAHIDFFGSYF